METVRVLHILNGLGSGGAESFIMNIYRNIDRTKVQFDFLIRCSQGNTLSEEIKRLGGHIYVTSSFPKNIFKNYNEVDTFFREHKKYNIVHVHANALIYIKPLTIAKKYGAKCIIIHSHNTQSANKLSALLHNWNKKFITNKATDFFACSNKAGMWMFDNKYKVIKNAVDIGKYAFNNEKRERIRKELQIEGKFVIGNIGRFVSQKNHSFLIDIFNEILKKNKNAVLLLIGIGKLEKEIRDKVELLKIEKNVIFMGVRKDVPDLLQTMDVFLLPSLFEGLPIVLIEAQTSGLKCITSDAITNETKVTSLIDFISLNKSAKVWADNVLKYSNGYERKIMFKQISDSGYNIQDVAMQLQNFYIKKS